MSIATEIQRIAGNVSAAFTAVRSKGGTVSQENSDHLATAIGTIPDPVTEAITVTANGTYHPRSGFDGFDEVEVDVPDTPLPTLTDPAAAGDILLHKEAIDGQGAKLTGSLDPLEDAELDPDSPPEIANGVLAIELVHGQTSVKELTCSVPDALPENIVSGKTILGVDGEAKKLTVIRNDPNYPYKPTSALRIASLQGMDSMPKAFLMRARNFLSLRESATETVKPIYAVNFCNVKDAYATGTTASANTIDATTDETANTKAKGLAAYISNTLRISFPEESGNNCFFIEGEEYDWKAYFWED